MPFSTLQMRVQVEASSGKPATGLIREYVPEPRRY
jgi:hypothetical protein